MPRSCVSSVGFLWGSPAEGGLVGILWGPRGPPWEAPPSLGILAVKAGPDYLLLGAWRRHGSLVARARSSSAARLRGGPLPAARRLYFPTHGHGPSGDPSRVWDQYQSALHICVLNFLVGCDHLLQRQARRDHRFEFTGGEQGEKAREIVPVPVGVLLLRRSCVIERDVLPLWWQ